jgi:hypothetical protein
MASLTINAISSKARASSRSKNLEQAEPQQNPLEEGGGYCRRYNDSHPSLRVGTRRPGLSLMLASWLFVSISILKTSVCLCCPVIGDDNDDPR